jgi:hypothetical protein
MRAFLPTIVFLAAACGAPSAQAQTLLVNGGFESQPNFGVNGDAGYTRLSGTQVPGWTIVSGHSVTVHSTALYPYISGSFSINTDGEGDSGHNADFYQDFGTTPGTGYQLTFDWQGWTDSGAAQLEVLVFDTVSSATLFDGIYGFSATLHPETATFAGTGNIFRLEIRESPESGFNDNKFVVDNFVVTAIPEPAAGAIASGLAVLALGLRRARRTARAG